MFSNTLIALYALALAGVAAAQGMTVATPASIVQCQPASLSWSGGTAPYFPSIIPGSQPGAAALKSFPSQTATTLVWTADLAAGTSITIQIRDSTGAVQYSSAITIQTSSDSSCVNASVSGTASAGSSAPATSAAAGSSTATAPAASTSAATSPAASVSASSASASHSASASASHSASASASATRTATSASASASNAASTVTKGAFGVAAFAGLIGATLF